MNPGTASTPQGAGSSPFPPGCAEKFAVQKLLASGGFGSVYLATQISLQRPVAVKLLHANVLKDDEQRQRFLNEARVTAALQHPNIVTVIDHGVEGDVPWIAYEYL